MSAAGQQRGAVSSRGSGSGSFMRLQLGCYPESLSLLKARPGLKDPLLGCFALVAVGRSLGLSLAVSKRARFFTTWLESSHQAGRESRRKGKDLGSTERAEKRYRLHYIMVLL